MDDRGGKHEEVDSVDREDVVPGGVGDEVVAVEHKASYQEGEFEQNKVTKYRMCPFPYVVQHLVPYAIR